MFNYLLLNWGASLKVKTLKSICKKINTDEEAVVVIKKNNTTSKKNK